MMKFCHRALTDNQYVCWCSGESAVTGVPNYLHFNFRLSGWRFNFENDAGDFFSVDQLNHNHVPVKAYYRAHYLFALDHDGTGPAEQDRLPAGRT